MAGIRITGQKQISLGEKLTHPPAEPTLDRKPVAGRVTHEWLESKAAIATILHLRSTVDHLPSAINTPTIPAHQLIQQDAGALVHFAARHDSKHKKTPAIAENFDHHRGNKWARQDSNLGPRPYQGRALTN
jgi:hypothetical protein